MKIKCKCTKFVPGNQITHINFIIENVRPDDILVEILRSSGKTLEDISFQKYYKYCAEEGSCIGTLPYIIRDQKYIWDEYIENVTVKEFMDTHNLSLEDPIEIETLGPCGAGGIDDLIQLWKAIWPFVKKAVNLMEFAVTFKEFIKMLPKPHHNFTGDEEEVVSPNTIFDAVYKQKHWTAMELAQKMDSDVSMAKNLLKLLEYTWDHQKQCYTITEEKMEERYKELCKAQQAIAVADID